MMRELYLHLGFMPEELTAKLKPHLEQETNWETNSILVITRDSLLEGRLFEQPFACYPSIVSEAIRREQYATTFENATEEKTTIYSSLVKEIEKFLDFSVETYRIEKVKSKLVNGKAKLSILQIGQGQINDIYLQFPEMGFQPVLAL